MSGSVEQQIAVLRSRLMNREKSAPWPSSAGMFRGVPQPPRALRATPGSMEATITWNAPADDRGIAGYHVFQGKESNLISGNLDRNVRQLKVKLSAGATDICFVSSVTTLGRESVRIPVVVTSNSDKYVQTGTTGETSGTTAQPSPGWTQERSGGYQTWRDRVLK